MPPCMDVYVWPQRCDAGALSQFIDHYVDRRNSRDDRLEAFIRTYVEGAARDDDRATLVELRCGDTQDGGFSLYVRARAHYGAIITITREGAIVLGLSINDPNNSPDVQARARALVEHLRGEFAAPAGCAGVELAPAHSRQEWEDDGLVQIRVGDLPPGVL